jgi:hypothetical protein
MPRDDRNLLDVLNFELEFLDRRLRAITARSLGAYFRAFPHLHEL